MARLLIVSPCGTHPRTEGNRERVFLLAQALAAAGHQVHLAVAGNDKFELGDPRAMRAYWGSRLHLLYPSVHWSTGFRARRLVAKAISPLLRTVLGVAPPGPAITTVDDMYCDWWGARLMLLQLQHRFRVVFGEYVFVSRCLLDFPRSVRTVIDTLDIFSGREEALKSARNIGGNWLSTDPVSEGRALDRAQIVLGIQEDESSRLRAMTRRPVVTVGHLVEPVRRELACESHRPRRILFVGSRSVVNVDGCAWFVENVLDRIGQRIPDVVFRVVGGVGARLAQRFPGHPRMEIAGRVDSLDAEYASTTVVINPVQFGTGLAIKSIEALAHGAVLLCTPEGARGIRWDPTSEAPFAVADSAESFAERLCTLLSDPLMRKRYGRAALDFISVWNGRHMANLVSVADPRIDCSSLPDLIDGRAPAIRSASTLEAT